MFLNNLLIKYPRRGLKLLKAKIGGIFMIIKIYMTSETFFYRRETSLQAFRAYVNSSNARGGSVITAYKNYDPETDELSGEVQIVLPNVEYFEQAY